MRVNLLMVCAGPALLVAIGAGAGIQVDEDPGAETQAALTRRACAELEAAESHLGEVMERLRIHFEGYPHMVRKLNAAQESWRSYLEAEVEFMYTAPEPGWFGSSRRRCLCDARKLLVEARARRIERLLAQPEDDLCVPALP
jgi:hypothetical protein